MTLRTPAIALTILALATAAAPADDFGLKSASANLQSVGPLAFGPDGILFVADPKSAAVWAIDTGDAAGATQPINVSDLGSQVAALLGSTQVRIVDMAVNPASGKAYLSVERGEGAEATAVILRVGADGKLEAVSLKNVKCASANLPNAPEDKITGEGRRRQNNRLFSITDLAYIDGRVIVAGLSNEEFASNLRAIPFPFNEVNPGVGVEIFHGAHGRLETRSPIRTFVPLTIEGVPQVIAAYTCTPLVRFPLDQVKSGTKITGTTIAELGNRNRPLDIIAYQKNGTAHLLMANSARGVMKISTEMIHSRPSIKEKIKGIAGQPYETIESLKGVTQLDRLGETHAAVLIEADGKQHLKSIPLP